MEAPNVTQHGTMQRWVDDLSEPATVFSALAAAAALLVFYRVFMSSTSPSNGLPGRVPLEIALTIYIVSNGGWASRI